MPYVITLFRYKAIFFADAETPLGVSGFSYVAYGVKPRLSESITATGLNLNDEADKTDYCKEAKLYVGYVGSEEFDTVEAVAHKSNEKLVYGNVGEPTAECGSAEHFDPLTEKENDKDR